MADMADCFKGDWRGRRSSIRRKRFPESNIVLEKRVCYGLNIRLKLLIVFLASSIRFFNKNQLILAEPRCS